MVASWRHIAKPVMTALNRPLAMRRTRRLVANEEGPYKVEIGSARSMHEGWIATDVGWSARYWLDATKPWPFPDGSVSHVYGDNVIEHLTLDEARLMLRHVRQALASGGGIRLVTPDAESFARMYLERGSLLSAQRERNLRHGYRVDHDVSVLRTVFAECGHHAGFIWDFTALSHELAAAGFEEIRRCEVGASADPSYRGLEARQEAPDLKLYLVVEARSIAAEGRVPKFARDPSARCRRP